MSAVERIAPREYGTIVVIGGGCYGSYYVRQLGRAAAAGAIAWRRLVVVDRNPACRVRNEFAASAGAGGPPRVESALLASAPRHRSPAPEIVTAQWADFLATYLAGATTSPAAAEHDAIVPSPLMPHLLAEWLLARATARWPGREVRSLPLDRPPTVPWERAGADGTHYVSFAEWMCPVNCIEPARCPHTRDARTWSMPPAMHAYVDEERARGRALAGPVVLHCTHRAYGVGMIDTRDVIDADRVVREAGTAGPARVLVGTVSHCHGALTLLAVSA